jgi:hypothetical protein
MRRFYRPRKLSAKSDLVCTYICSLPWDQRSRQCQAPPCPPLCRVGSRFGSSIICLRKTTTFVRKACIQRSGVCCAAWVQVPGMYVGTYIAGCPKSPAMGDMTCSTVEYM